MNENFAANLKSLCAEFGSISQICRDIGINRQQFNRYLNGSSLPSAHNLRRIARHFGLTERQLFSDELSFEQALRATPTDPTATPVEQFMQPFRDQQQNLRRYAGFYHSYFCTPSWEGKIFCSLIRIVERDGMMVIKSRESAVSADNSVRQISRYEGLVTMRGNRIFATEHEMIREGSVAQTVLHTAHRQELKYLRGMTMGLAWRPFPHPYAAKTIWKRLDERVSARDAIRACGIYPQHSTRIDPAIRKYLEVGT
ncbi:helix-turn-helix transcriptional regulator [Phaeobacter sp.]|uniref:helix-turn-helix transcriptional regulator n=1 Tax=Phaeobacter sp. TaxID=1902409 RepID=UPI0025D3D170|nr:helix-turn-helix transcriptional regulator [Phaeobacter sp.]